MHTRKLREGLIEAYIHQNGRVGALVEVNCETDFLARTEEFHKLAREIAMRGATMNPTSIGSMDVLDDNEEALLNQEYIRDARLTIRELIRRTMSEVGEEIEVARFVRFELAEEGE
jgi:elongation factor Ts